MQVEMDQVFTGFVSLLNIKGKPGATAKIMASAIPFCGSAAYTYAAAEGRPYCAGVNLDGSLHESLSVFLPSVASDCALHCILLDSSQHDPRGWAAVHDATRVCL